MIDHEAQIAALEQTGEYRVLRRLHAPTPSPDAGDDGVLGIVLDVETTGLDPAADEIVELAMLPFRYRPDGTICHIGAPYRSLRQPGRPIPPEMTAIHGINDEIVAGHQIDVETVCALIAGAAPIIAHHADFDRRFCERLIPEFCERPWACSRSQIDWREEGFDGSGLGYLALASGFFYDRHHAETDCGALLELLSRPLPVSGVPALARLLETGRKPTYRVYAENSPFALKDTLKRRGYSWDPDRKVWYVDALDADAETAWLRENIYRGRAVDFPIQKITAFTRFSDRIGVLQP